MEASGRNLIRAGRIILDSNPVEAVRVTSKHVGALLAFGVKPDMPSNTHLVPLHVTPLLACVGVHQDRRRHAVEITEMLLAAGADPRATMVGCEDEHFVARTPMIWAVDQLHDILKNSRSPEDVDVQDVAACMHIVLKLGLAMAKVATWNTLSVHAFAELKKTVAQQSEVYALSQMDLVQEDVKDGFGAVVLFYSTYLGSFALSPRG